MKKLLLTFCSLCFMISTLFAQYNRKEKEKEKEEKEKGFKKENLFTGGSVSLAFYNSTFLIGASPIFGYKLANWMDAGVVVNYTYASQRDVKEFDDRLKQSVYGGGLFTRIYPLNFLFLQGQFEHNFTTLKYDPAPNSFLYLPTRQTVEANSLLVGAGYTEGRRRGSNTFFYVAVLVDVLKNVNSPYVDLVYNPTTGQYVARAVPIIRAGINVGLFEGGNRRRR